MQPSNRIVVNTFVQYLRTIINMILSLYSSRLVLNIIGVDDYGIYTLVAGVVSMLSFLTNSLVGSTQRFLSVSQGKGNLDILKEVFNNSLILHILIGFVVTVALECLTPFLFNGFLKIPADRYNIAILLYQQVIWMVYVSFIASPFRALLVSRENIVYISLIDVLDGGLKVLLVLLLPFISSDKLYGYGWIMLSIQLINLFAYMIYCYIKYEECVLPKWGMFSWSYVKELSSYTGWVVYSTVVIAARNQGVALVINRFYSLAINAAYGIGSQIASMLAFVSSSFTNAISPQLMAAKGAGNYNKMWSLAEIQSKFSFLLLAMLAIPTIFEMPTLLSLWLGQVPEKAVMFACMFIVMQTLDQLSLGLGLVNRAKGNIGKYTLITFTPKLIILPLAVVLLNYEFSLVYIALLMVIIEYFCMILRIYLFRNNENFSAKSFCENVLWRTLYPVVITLIIVYGFVQLYDFKFRFFITYCVGLTVFAVASYFLALNKRERSMIVEILCRLF